MRAVTSDLVVPRNAADVITSSILHRVTLMPKLCKLKKYQWLWQMLLQTEPLQMGKHQKTGLIKLKQNLKWEFQAQKPLRLRLDRCSGKHAPVGS